MEVFVAFQFGKKQILDMINTLEEDEYNEILKPPPPDPKLPEPKTPEPAREPEDKGLHYSNGAKYVRPKRYVKKVDPMRPITFEYGPSGYKTNEMRAAAKYREMPDPMVHNLLLSDFAQLLELNSYLWANGKYKPIAVRMHVRR